MLIQINCKKKDLGPNDMIYNIITVLCSKISLQNYTLKMHTQLKLKPDFRVKFRVKMATLTKANFLLLNINTTSRLHEINQF